MIFLMLAIVIFSIPGIMLVWSTAYTKSLKKDSVKWKLPALLQLLLIFLAMVMHIYLLHTYGFPLLETNMEILIGMGIILLICGVMFMMNIIITKKLGSITPSHNSKVVNIITLCFAFYFFIILFIAAPLGNKISFAVSINEAMDAAGNANYEEFSVVLVNSEKGCLRRMTQYCREDMYRNQFFIKNNLPKTQEVQVKIRTLNSDNEEMKVIDSKTMTLKPGETQLLKTKETITDASIWNQYSFQTEGRIHQYQQKLRYREAD